MELLALLLTIGCSAIAVTIALLWTKDREQKNYQGELYLASMNSLYQALDRRIAYTRRYRHDLAKHIRTLEELLDDQARSSEGMRSIVLELKERYASLTHNTYCADEIVNAMLCVKEEECRNKAIPFQAEVGDGDYKRLRGIDMVGLLYNLLDNAIEANELLPEENRGIRFAMTGEAGNLSIRLENHYLPGAEPVFESRKRKHGDHGLGSGIISEIVERYHGSWAVEENRRKGILRQALTLTLLGKEGEA